MLAEVGIVFPLCEVVHSVNTYLYKSATFWRVFLVVVCLFVLLNDIVKIYLILEESRLVKHKD